MTEDDVQQIENIMFSTYAKKADKDGVVTIKRGSDDAVYALFRIKGKGSVIEMSEGNYYVETKKDMLTNHKPFDKIKI